MESTAKSASIDTTSYSGTYDLNFTGTDATTHKVTFTYEDGQVSKVQETTNAPTDVDFSSNTGTVAGITFKLTDDAFADGKLETKEVTLSKEWNNGEAATYSDTMTDSAADGLETAKVGSGNLVKYKFDDTHYYAFLIDTTTGKLVQPTSTMSVEGIQFSSANPIAFGTSADALAAVTATLDTSGSNNSITITNDADKVEIDNVDQEGAKTLTVTYGLKNGKLTVTPTGGLNLTDAKVIAQASFGKFASGDNEGAYSDSTITMSGYYSADDYGKATGSAPTKNGFELTFTAPKYAEGFDNASLAGKSVKLSLSNIAGITGTYDGTANGGTGTTTDPYLGSNSEFVKGTTTGANAWQGAFTVTVDGTTYNFGTANLTMGLLRGTAEATGKSVAIGTGGKYLTSIGDVNTAAKSSSMIGETGQLSTSGISNYTGAYLQYDADANTLTFVSSTDNEKKSATKIVWTLGGTAGNGIVVTERNYNSTTKTTNDKAVATWTATGTTAGADSSAGSLKNLEIFLEKMAVQGGGNAKAVTLDDTNRDFTGAVTYKYNITVGGKAGVLTVPVGEDGKVGDMTLSIAGGAAIAAVAGETDTTFDDGAGNVVTLEGVIKGATFEGAVKTALESKDSYSIAVASDPTTAKGNAVVGSVAITIADKTVKVTAASATTLTVDTTDAESAKWTITSADGGQTWTAKSTDDATKTYTFEVQTTPVTSLATLQTATLNGDATVTTTPANASDVSSTTYTGAGTYTYNGNGTDKIIFTVNGAGYITNISAGASTTNTSVTAKGKIGNYVFNDAVTAYTANPLAGTLWSDYSSKVEEGVTYSADVTTTAAVFAGGVTLTPTLALLGSPVITATHTAGLVSAAAAAADQNAAVTYTYAAGTVPTSAGNTTIKVSQDGTEIGELTVTGMNAATTADDSLAIKADAVKFKLKDIAASGVGALTLKAPDEPDGTKTADVTIPGIGDITLTFTFGGSSSANVLSKVKGAGETDEKITIAEVSAAADTKTDLAISYDGKEVGKLSLADVTTSTSYSTTSIATNKVSFTGTEVVATAVIDGYAADSTYTATMTGGKEGDTSIVVTMNAGTKDAATIKSIKVGSTTVSETVSAVTTVGDYTVPSIQPGTSNAGWVTTNLGATSDKIDYTPELDLGDPVSATSGEADTYDVKINDNLTVSVAWDANLNDNAGAYKITGATGTQALIEDTDYTLSNDKLTLTLNDTGKGKVTGAATGDSYQIIPGSGTAGDGKGGNDTFTCKAVTTATDATTTLDPTTTYDSVPITIDGKVVKITAVNATRMTTDQNDDESKKWTITSTDGGTTWTAKSSENATKVYTITLSGATTSLATLAAAGTTIAGDSLVTTTDATAAVEDETARANGAGFYAINIGNGDYLCITKAADGTLTLTNDGIKVVTTDKAPTTFPAASTSTNKYTAITITGVNGGASIGDYGNTAAKTFTVNGAAAGTGAQLEAAATATFAGVSGGTTAAELATAMTAVLSDDFAMGTKYTSGSTTLYTLPSTYAATGSLAGKRMTLTAGTLSASSISQTELTRLVENTTRTVADTDGNTTVAGTMSAPSIAENQEIVQLTFGARTFYAIGYWQSTLAASAAVTPANLQSDATKGAHFYVTALYNQAGVIADSGNDGLSSDGGMIKVANGTGNVVIQRVNDNDTMRLRVTQTAIAAATLVGEPTTTTLYGGTNGLKMTDASVAGTAPVTVFTLENGEVSEVSKSIYQTAEVFGDYSENYDTITKEAAKTMTKSSSADDWKKQINATFLKNAYTATTYAEALKGNAAGVSFKASDGSGYTGTIVLGGNAAPVALVDSSGTKVTELYAGYTTDSLDANFALTGLYTDLGKTKEYSGDIKLDTSANTVTVGEMVYTISAKNHSDVTISLTSGEIHPDETTDTTVARYTKIEVGYTQPRPLYRATIKALIYNNPICTSPSLYSSVYLVLSAIEQPLDIVLVPQDD